MKRSELRDHIFKLLFSFVFTDEEEMPEQIDLYVDFVEDASDADLKYIRTKAGAVFAKAEEIDEIINTNTVKWKTSRMNKVDLTILRLAVYEMLFDDDVPVGVAIDQAVELAKKYSGDQGPSFVNGVLGKIEKANSNK